MASAVDAIEYLEAPERHPLRPVSVVFGDEPFFKRRVLAELRQMALGGGDADFSLSTLDGTLAELRDVLDELSTMAMFGGGRRLVIVEKADDFVTRYRPELEDYVAKPRQTGLLVLEVRSFLATTRLYKAVVKHGLAVDCKAPTTAQLTRWLVNWAKRTHHIELTLAAAKQLVERVGPELGLLDQELAKLALAVVPGEKVGPKTVDEMVGTWRAKTAWNMLDAALDGNVREAMVQLDRLLLAGEVPVAVLGQISATLRRLAAATRLILRAERGGRRLSLGAGLEQAGVPSFFVGKSERQLRRLGRERGESLYSWLLQADLDLKGASSLPPRLVLEDLVLRLAAPRQRQGAER